jgi:hypothetical protein
MMRGLGRICGPSSDILLFRASLVDHSADEGERAVALLRAEHETNTNLHGP